MHAVAEFTNREPDTTATRILSGPELSIGSTALAGVTFEIITTRQAFDALEHEWNALFERAASGTHLFQSFNWLWHWANHFLAKHAEDGPRLATVIARRDGKLVLVWPLVAQRRGPLTKLSWMGEPVSQYGDILVEGTAYAPHLLRAAWNFLREQSGASVLQLRKVRADSNVAALMHEIGAKSVEHLVAPFLDLTEAKSFEDYEERYAGHERRNRKRQRRRFNERGPHHLEAFTRGTEARRLSGVAIELKRKWLAARGLVSPAIADERTKLFFADVCEATIRPAGCHVLALTSNGQPAALEIGLVCKGHAAIHVIVYDQDYEKQAAGSLLMEDSIRRAYSLGCRTYDLLAPGDAYKLNWADKTIEVADWAMPLTPAGHAYTDIYLGVLRSLGKRMITAMPPTLRRHLLATLAVLSVVPVQG